MNIPPGFIEHWGPGGLLTLVVLLVLSGKLVPRSTLRDTQRERDQWRVAAEKDGETLGQVLSISKELLDLSRTNNHLIESLPERGRSGGGGS